MGHAGDGGPAREHVGSDTFRRAVAREHKAIAVHEHAADMHDAVAERLEAMADVESDPGLAARRREDAAVERTRSEAARARAAAARKRLTEEGQS
jgi:hypothetical protein